MFPTQSLITYLIHAKSILHNAEGGCLSACPTGDRLESQRYVTTLEKGITIIKCCALMCLDLTVERISESASSSSLDIEIGACNQ